MAEAKGGAVECAAVDLAECVEDGVGAVWEEASEPVGEEVLDLVGESEGDVGGGGGAGVGGGAEEGWDLVVVDPGDDGRGHHGDGDAGVGEGADGGEAIARGTGAGLHDGGEARVEGGEADGGCGGVVAREVGEEVGVALDEAVLGDEGDGLAEVAADLEATACDAEVALDGLVGIGDAAEDDGLAAPGGASEFATEEIGGVVLGEEAGFEVEAGGEAEVLVAWSCVAVDAPVLAAAVGVEGPVEGEVGGIDAVEDGAGVVGLDGGGELSAVGGVAGEVVEV